MNDLEIYVRHSAGKALLMLHAPEALRAIVLAAVKGGEVDSTKARIHLELSILPEWITDPSVRKQVSKIHDPIHIRIPISALSMDFSAEPLENRPIAK
jgi:hypothetical protein